MQKEEGKEKQNKTRHKNVPIVKDALLSTEIQLSYLYQNTITIVTHPPVLSTASIICFYEFSESVQKQVILSSKYQTVFVTDYQEYSLLVSTNYIHFTQ